MTLLNFMENYFQKLEQNKLYEIDFANKKLKLVSFKN